MSLQSHDFPKIVGISHISRCHGCKNMMSASITFFQLKIWYKSRVSHFILNKSRVLLLHWSVYEKQYTTYYLVMCEAADQVNRPVKLCQISFDDSLWESLWLLKGSEFTGKGTANWLYGFKKTRSGLLSLVTIERLRLHRTDLRKNLKRITKK